MNGIAEIILSKITDGPNCSPSSRLVSWEANTNKTRLITKPITGCIFISFFINKINLVYDSLYKLLTNGKTLFATIN